MDAEFTKLVFDQMPRIARMGYTTAYRYFRIGPSLVIIMILMKNVVNEAERL